MKLIICVSNSGGTSFNKRRLSRDALLVKDVMGLIGTDKCFISPYSLPLFDGFSDRVICTEAYLSSAEDNDFCFFEIGNLDEYMKKTDEVYLYKWNRTYPADTFFSIPREYEELERNDFAGSSHKKITRIHYRRKENA